MHSHKWNVNPPIKGKSFCVRPDCKQIYRGKGRPPGTGGNAPTFGVPLDDASQSVLVDLASEMTGVVPETLVEDSIDAPEEQSQNAPQEQNVTPRSSGWTKHAGPRIAKLFVMACETVGDMLKPKRIPKEPEQVDVDEFGEAMGLQLAIWFPDSEMSPMKRLILAGAAIGGSMYIGSKKVIPEQDQPPKQPNMSAQPAATNSYAKTPEQVRDTVAPTAAAIFGGNSF